MPKKKKGKAKRRLKGTGSRFPSEKRKCYVGRVIVGRYPSGKPKYAQRQAKTVEELEDRLKEAAPPAKGVTLNEWLTRWLSELTCKPGTMRNRRAAVNHHIGPSLGHLKVAEITPRQVELAVARWKVKSVNTKRHMASVLGTALRDAQRAGLRPDNPAAAARKPRSVKRKLDPFTAEELARICREAVKRTHTRSFALLAVTGMRVGECIALDVPDADLERGTVSITKTYDTQEKKSGTPKSANGFRTIRVPAVPPEALQAVRDAVGTRKAGPLFATATGRRNTYNGLANNWEVFLKKLGIRARGFHQMRHAVASIHLANGVDVAEVAKYLGDTPDTITKTYCHATGRVDPASVLEGVFRGLQGDSEVTDGQGKRAKRHES